MATTSPPGRRPAGASGATARRRAPTPPAPDPVPDRRPSLTGRAAVLAFVVGALVLSLALPVREFFTQRAVLDDLAERTAASQARLAALQEQERRWRDPSYVRAQARERLHFVMPGEVGYVVLGGEGQQATGDLSPAADGTVEAWYSTLWGSVEAAGATAPAEPGPEPSVRPGAPR